MSQHLFRNAADGSGDKKDAPVIQSLKAQHSLEEVDHRSSLGVDPTIKLFTTHATLSRQV
ncbi:MAG TPA: hypothetical protein ACQGQH_00535 [Xylella sp.]